MGAYQPLGSLWQAGLFAAFATGAAALLFVISAGRKRVPGKDPAGSRLTRVVDILHGAQQVRSAR